VRDERGDVGAEEVLAVADADHERAAAPGRHEGVGLGGRGGDEGEGPFQAPADLAHRLGQAALALGRGVEGPCQQVGGDLGVGLRGELDAVLLALGAEGGEVLDDPVVDHRDRAVGRQVGVRVAVGRTTVGRPPGVPDADGGRRQRVLGQHLLQVRQLAGLLGRAQRPVGDDGDPSGVVAPVLEPAQAFDDHVPGVLRTDISHDAAHWAESTGSGGPIRPGERAERSFCRRSHPRRTAPLS
jgi:hypothetical protein